MKVWPISQLRKVVISTSMSPKISAHFVLLVNFQWLFCKMPVLINSIVNLIAINIDYTDVKLFNIDIDLQYIVY